MSEYGTKLHGGNQMESESDVENEYLLEIGNRLDDITFLSACLIEEKIALLPKICRFTDKLIWFHRAIRARRLVRLLDGTIDFEDRWYNSKEFMLFQLKGF